MKINLQELQNMLRKQLDIELVKRNELIKMKRDSEDLAFISAIKNIDTAKVLKFLSHSKSQLRQDLFVLSELDFMKKGYFIEFGATNGVDLSNTHLLEKKFDWKGILAEPAKVWHKHLKSNRRAKITFDCVWKKTGEEIIFNQFDKAELSTIEGYKDKDYNANSRNNANTYAVKTVSLVDLLDKFDAPAHIDYLSIDTEGSELEILQNFDFDKYSFSVITCEHNYTTDREKLYKLFTSNGYVRKYEEISNFDDWYVRKN